MPRTYGCALLVDRHCMSSYPGHSNLADELKCLSDACSQQVDSALRMMQQQDDIAQRAITRLYTHQVKRRLVWKLSFVVPERCAIIVQETLAEKTHALLYNSEDGKLRTLPSRGLDLLSSQSSSEEISDVPRIEERRGRSSESDKGRPNMKCFDDTAQADSMALHHSGSTISTKFPPSQHTYQSTALSASASRSGSGLLRGHMGQFPHSPGALSSAARVQMNL
eukprot:6044810-Amphidinium_carterae.1